MSIGLRISKPGINVLTATQLNQFSVNTDYDSFKFMGIISGSLSASIGNGTASSTSNIYNPLSVVSTFPYYFFTYCTDGSGSHYDYATTNFSSFYVSQNPVNSQLIALLNYNSGAIPYTINYSIYVFGNQL